MTFVAYNRVEDLLKPEELINDESTASGESKPSKLDNFMIINSRVLGASFSVKTNHESKNVKLSHPISIVFRHIKDEVASRPQCVSWSQEMGDWFDSGCHVLATNSSHTVCACDHLGHFAILMDNRPYELLKNGYNWLRLVIIIGSIITSLCLLFILTILFTIHGDNREVLSVHKNLCITLLLTELTFFIGVFQTDSQVTCKLTSGLLQFFLLSSFIWAFLEAFDLFMNLIEIFESKRSNRVWWYHGLTFGLPALITIISILINPYSHGTAYYCWLRVDNNLWITLAGPLILTLIASFLFIFISCFILTHNSGIHLAIKSKEQSRIDEVRCGLKWVILLMIILTTTWILGLFTLNYQESLFLGLAFTMSNIVLGLYVVLFCIIRTDSIQNHKIASHLPLMNLCFGEEDDQSTGKGNVINSSAYGAHPLPVVTQMATQVSGLVSSPPRHLVITNNSLPIYPSNGSSQITSVRLCSLASGIASS